MEKNVKAYLKTPIGVLELVGSEKGLKEINFSKEELYTDILPNELEKAFKQLNEYFEGKRKNFDLELIIEGTEFQKKVWQALRDTGYGTLATYKDIAVSINNEKAVRAVGNANHNNKLPIVIPCHRIIGANGKLVGYAGELWRKEWLIKHEKSYIVNK